MSQSQDMAPERRMAVEAMQNMGWTARRVPGKSGWWEFRRPDTGGLEDLVRRKQQQLSMHWVADIAMRHGNAVELSAEIQRATDRWLRQRFRGIYMRAEEEA